MQVLNLVSIDNLINFLYKNCIQMSYRMCVDNFLKNKNSTQNLLF